MLAHFNTHIQMKISTFLVAFIHLVYIIGFMWLAPYFIYLNVYKKPCVLTSYMVFWIFVIVVQILHWGTAIMNNECILSYWEKKLEDPNYVKGSEPNKTYAWILLQNVTGNIASIQQIRAFHMIATKVAFFFAVVSLTVMNDCMKFMKDVQVKLIAYAVLTGLVLQYLCFDSAVFTNSDKNEGFYIASL